MVEKTKTGEGHRNAVAVAGLNDLIISNRAARLGDVGDTALSCTLDIVSEGEESVRSERNPLKTVKPSALRLPGKGRGLKRKYAFPATVTKQILALIADVDINRVVALRAAYLRAEGKL